MIHLNDLLDTWEKDCDIDETEPGKEQLRIPKLHSKYLKYMMEARMLSKKLDTELKELKKFKYEYYNGNFNGDKEFLKEKGLEPFRFILKDKLDTYITSDTEVLKLEEKKAYCDETSKACEMIIKELGNRVWQLKGKIDWEKFINGN